MADKWMQDVHPKKGALHEQLHIPQGQKIPTSRLRSAAHSGSPLEKKRANLALRYRGLGEGGIVETVEGPDEDFSQEGKPSLAEQIQAMMRGGIVTTPGPDEDFSQDGEPPVAHLADGGVGLPPASGQPQAARWPQVGGGQPQAGQQGWGGGGFRQHMRHQWGGQRGQGQGGGQGWGGGGGGGQLPPPVQRPPVQSGTGTAQPWGGPAPGVTPGIVHAQGMAAGGVVPGYGGPLRGYPGGGVGGPPVGTGGGGAPFRAPIRPTPVAPVRATMASGGVVESGDVEEGEKEKVRGEGKKARPARPFQFSRYRG